MWLCQVLVVARAIFNLPLDVAWGLPCGMWDLVPWLGVEPRPLALGAPSLSHWTPTEVPVYVLIQNLNEHMKANTLQEGNVWSVAILSTAAQHVS